MLRQRGLAEIYCPTKRRDRHLVFQCKSAKYEKPVLVREKPQRRADGSGFLFKRFSLRRTHPLPFTLVVTKLVTANVTVKTAPPLAEGEPYDEE
jgi:hypothetical protein